ncbi:hillarin-like [Mytilus californianus]|uniref:hillarin-like n=1 Tax=Mytilus californianus TaxID=6549 RepID=UPI002245C8A0|nr:hillarin-like [Mytilus californianus]
MGTGASVGENLPKDKKTGTNLREPEEEDVNVPDIPRDDIYPSPHPSLIKKNDIYQSWKYRDVVNHVIKAPPRLQRSFDDLIAYLAHPFRHEMQKLRAIFVWVCTQHIDGMSFKGFTDNMTTQDHAVTPLGYFKLIKYKRASYATFLALLCRKAGIKCVVIKGISKSMGYNVGDKDLSKLRTKWNAVYIKDSWRLIHPLWACKSVIGKADYTSWTAFSENEEETVEGWTVQKINDFFFLTDPLDFIHFCFPDDPGWQLLANQFTLNRYIQLPFVQEAYFRMGFRLLTQHSCILKSMNGQIEVVIRIPEKEKVQMNFELLYSKKNVTNIEGDRYKLDRFVIMSNDGKRYSFLVRFPHEGIYKFSVFGGGLRHSVIPWLADFQLKCDKTRLNAQPIPVAPWIGFGVTYAFDDCGLANPTERNGVLYMKVFHDTVLSFDVTRPIQIEMKLKHNTLKQRELEHRITWKKSPSRFDVFVKIPQAGDYVIRIFIRDKGSRGKYRNCINYLITTDEPIYKTRKGYEDAAERNLRNTVKDVTSQRDINRLKDTIIKFKKAGLDDKGEYTKASVRLELLEVKQGLLDGINARNKALLIKSIQNAKDGGYSKKLAKLIQQAEETLEEIQKLGLHPIPNINKKIISELVSYKIPHQIVYDMSYATFILLGEKEENIKEWDYMKGLMKKTGRDNIMNRFKNFRLDDVPTREIGIAQKLVVDYHESQIRQISIGATSLFNWLIEILQVKNVGSPTERSNNIGYPR